MKKFLSVILVLMLALSTVLITACNNDNEQANTDNSEQSSSYEDESSSSRRRGEGAGSGSGTTTSSSGAGTSSEGNLPNSSTQNPPTSSTKPSTSYGDYDYNYTQSAVDPSEYNSPAGRLDKYIYLFVEDFPRPTLKGEFYPTLVSLEEQYNALSSIDKALVQNYSILLEAREIYVRMAKEEAEKLIGDLPDATISNLTDFGTQASAIQKLLDNIGAVEANKISNINDYNQKVNKADSLLIDTFNAQIALLENFVYEPAYKEKLDYAYVIYGLMNASQQSRVAQGYSKLSSLNKRYADAAVAYDFVATVENLPDIDNLKDTDQAIIKELKRVYNKMTDAEKAEIPAATKAKYDAYVAKASTLWPEHVLYAAYDKRWGDDFFKYNSQFSSAGRAEAPANYENTLQSNGVKFKSTCTVTFTTTKAGVFTVYANVRVKEENPCDLVLSFDGKEIARQAVKNDPTGENCEYTFACDAIGTYVLSCNTDPSGDGAILYYLIFS